MYLDLVVASFIVKIRVINHTLLTLVQGTPLF